VQLPTPADELQAAAHWARTQLERNPRARVGVIVPDLTRVRFAVRHAFGDVFRDAPDVFDLTGGEPLAQTPSWRTACLLARYDWARGHHPELKHLARARGFERAPGLEGIGMIERGLCDAPSNDPLRVKIGRPWTDSAASLAVWARRMLDVLNAVGLRATATGSVQFQTRAAIAARLAELADRPMGEVLTFEQALARIDFLLDRHPFAAKRGAAPVLAMGYLEAAGLCFDHLWVMGLTDDRWPRRASPNPLLPIGVQRAAGVPGVDAEGERRLAEALWAQWCTATPDLIASHAERDGDTVLRPASSIAALGCVGIDAVLPDTPAGRKWQSPEPVALVPGALPRARAHSVLTIRGGALLLQDQALCPFRGWAVHALGLSAPEAPRDLPDARERGTLLHELMDELYRTSAPHTPSPETIDPAIERILEREQHLPAAYVANDRERLATIARAWLALDAARPPFVVAATETSTTLRLCGVEVRLRIDRIDRIDGEPVVIDYKSGPARLPAIETGRLLEPQLPLYALALQGASGAAYAVLDRTRPALKVLGCVPVTAAAPMDRATWLETLRRWQRQLDGLMRDHLDGLAAVDPAPGACASCHLARFCRVAAQ
jgi:probable DNA repair protein